MIPPKPSLRMLGAALTLFLLAGCMRQTPVATGPELAGAWYQVYFDTNSVAINDRARVIFDRVRVLLAENNASRVTVIGKTDRAGDRPANMLLSERRADAVRDALIASGVPANRIDTSWTGERHQAVATADGVDEAFNRVVDITVVKPPN